MIILAVNRHTNLVTEMQSKYNGYYPSGRVPSMMLCPFVMCVLKEGWIYNYHLDGTHRRNS